MRQSQKRIGEILIGLGVITLEQLDDALREQRQSKELIGLILLKKGFLREESLLEALSEQFGIPVIPLRNRKIDWELVRIFSPTLLLDYRCFPVSRDAWSVTFAITNPLDLWAIKKIEEESAGLKLRLALVLHEELNEILGVYKTRLRHHLTTLLE